MQERGGTATNSTYRGVIRIEGEENIQEKCGDKWGKSIKIKCVISDRA